MPTLGGALAQSAPPSCLRSNPTSASSTWSCGREPADDDPYGARRLGGRGGVGVAAPPPQRTFRLAPTGCAAGPGPSALAVPSLGQLASLPLVRSGGQVARPAAANGSRRMVVAA